MQRPENSVVVTIRHVLGGIKEEVTHKNFQVRSSCNWNRRCVGHVQYSDQDATNVVAFDINVCDVRISIMNLLSQTLEPGRLLSDNVINPYFALLAARDEKVRSSFVANVPDAFML